MTACHDFIRTHETVESTTALHSQRSDSPQNLILRPGFAFHSGRNGRNLGESPFPPPRACPLGRHTLDVRASIMLAPIIVIYFELSTVFSGFFRIFLLIFALRPFRQRGSPGSGEKFRRFFAQFAQPPPGLLWFCQAKRRFLEKRLTWGAEMLQ